MSREFSFPFTCSRIDSVQESIKTQISRDLDSIAIDLGRYAEREIEALRKLNEEMRAAAESQIESLNDTIGDLECQVAELKLRLAQYE